MDIQAVNPVNGTERVAETAAQVLSPPKPAVEEVSRVEEKTQEAKAQEAKESLLSVEDAKGLTEQMNYAMDGLQTSLGFSIREEHNHLVVIEIKDRETNELIKQIPSEELLAIKEKMDEFTGLLFDQSV